MKLWQSRILATLTRNKNLKYISQLIGYFDKVGEMGDPEEANQLLGHSSITLSEWINSLNH